MTTTESNAKEEREMLEGFLNGDRKSIRLFIERYDGYIRKAVSHIDVRTNAVTFSDLYHGAYEHILDNDKKAIREFNYRSRFSTYLYIVCRRYALKIAMGENRKPDKFAELEFPAIDLTDTFDEESDIGSDEKNEMLKTAINSLDINSQLLIKVMFYCKWSTAYIMNFFGLNSENSVFSKKHKVIKKLTKEYKRLLLQRKKPE